MANNPYQTPPPYEKWVGDLEGAYSRRINIQPRLVYQVSRDARPCVSTKNCQGDTDVVAL
ncbi:MAG: hypothetical protein VSS75_025260 [Candidatus Parabeggiatoa sp.]|nr:hypothetical protein [Candidatus Parabeggiatoa sp.]